MKSARVLLVIFAVSISLMQLIDLGHGVLHTFKNPIHYHKARQYKDFKDHSLADHHFPKMKFAHEMDEPQSPTNFIAMAYFFFQSVDEYNFSNTSRAGNSFPNVFGPDYGVYQSPPTPPPLVVG